MSSLKQLLRDLMRVPGVHSAVVVDRDGFALEQISVLDEIDPEMIGVILSTGVSSVGVMGRELLIGDMRQSMMEYDGGIVVTSALGKDAILAIVADQASNVGQIRYQVKKFSTAIADVL